jgi:hypothetical protein
VAATCMSLASLTPPVADQESGDDAPEIESESGAEPDEEPEEGSGRELVPKKKSKPERRRVKGNKKATKKKQRIVTYQHCDGLDCNSSLTDIRDLDHDKVVDETSCLIEQFLLGADVRA